MLYQEPLFTVAVYLRAVVTCVPDKVAMAWLHMYWHATHMLSIIAAHPGVARAYTGDALPLSAVVKHAFSPRIVQRTVGTAKH